MLSKTLVASAAVAAALVAAVPAEQAQAKTNIDIGIGLGVGGYYPGYPVYDDVDVYDAGYYGRRHMRGMTCGQAADEVRAEGFRRVRAIDCSRPIYGFRAERHGRPVVVKVNLRGDIVSVRRGYGY
jgi:hypothetical protein